MALSPSLRRAFCQALPTVIAAVFLLSCLATAAHLAMAGGEGCQAIEPSVRSCGPTTSLYTAPALPAVALDLDSSPAPTEWVTLTLPLAGFSQHEGAPPVPRSPPSIPA